MKRKTTRGAEKPWHVEVGECLAVLRELPTASVDGVITDPPYCSGGLHSSARMASTTSKYVQSGQQLQRADFPGDNRDQRSFLAWCALWLSECLRIAKPGAPLCVFTDWRQLPVTTDAVQVGGWVWRGIVPWNKTAAVRPCVGRFRSQCEYVVFASNGPLPRRTDIGVLPGFFEKHLVPSDRHHIAGKPVEILEEMVRIVPEGGLVLDPFAGSGSTGVAALRLGRRFLGIEITDEFAVTARKRLESDESKPQSKAA